MLLPARVSRADTPVCVTRVEPGSGFVVVGVSERRADPKMATTITSPAKRTRSSLPSVSPAADVRGPNRGERTLKQYLYPSEFSARRAMTISRSSPPRVTSASARPVHIREAEAIREGFGDVFPALHVLTLQLQNDARITPVGRKCAGSEWS